MIISSHFFFQTLCSNVGNVIDKLSLRVEDAAHEIVDIFKESLREIGITELCAKPKPVDKEKEKKPDSRDGKDKEAPKEKAKPTDEKTLQEEIDELILHFNHKTFEALLKATRNALDGIKRRIFCTRYTMIATDHRMVKIFSKMFSHISHWVRDAFSSGITAKLSQNIELNRYYKTFTISFKFCFAKYFDMCCI